MTNLVRAVAPVIVEPLVEAAACIVVGALSPILIPVGIAVLLWPDVPPRRPSPQDY